MARASATLTNSSASLAAFNAYAGGISSLLQQVASKTTDTGQATFPVGALPAVGANTTYEIYRFNDTLQTSAPIFIRVDYRNGYNQTGQAQALFSVGTGTDGAGNLQNATPQIVLQTYLGTFASMHLVANGDGSQLVFVQGINSVATPSIDNMGALVIERFRNADGSPNADGVTVFTWQNQAANFTGYGVGAQARIFASSVGWTPDTLPAVVIPWLSLGPASSFSGSTATAYPFYTWGERQLRGPSQAVLYGYRYDWSRNMEISVTHSGASKKWWSMGSACSLTLPAVNAAASAYVGSQALTALFRYE